LTANPAQAIIWSSKQVHQFRIEKFTSNLNPRFWQELCKHHQFPQLAVHLRPDEAGGALVSGRLCGSSAAGDS
jgi:hypothetical protein